MATRIPPHKIAPVQMPHYLPGSFYQALGGGGLGGVHLQRYSHHSTPASLTIPAVAEPLLVLVLAGSARVQEREAGQRWEAYTVGCDDFFLTMTAVPYQMRWHTEAGQGFEVVHVYLGQGLLADAARDVLGRAVPGLRLRDIGAGRDPQVSQLVRGLYQESARAGTPSAMYVQGLSQALAVHLVRHYRDPHSADAPANALPAYKLHRVQARMAATLAQPFSLALLAAEAGMSRYHFSRLFHRATGQTASQYFIRLRMEKACELLRAGTLSVIDIALEVGYASPSHFSHVFRRHAGVAPLAYRQR